MSAYKVLSLPMPTLFPGLNTVPFCLTKIFPAVTNCPPYLFTPSLFALESRPFLVLPAPFLCAIFSPILIKY